MAGQRVPVGGKYRLSCRGAQVTCGFVVAAYDCSRPLVIDPVLIYSTYVGGFVMDQARGIAVDGSGAAYVTGSTASPNFPLQQALQGSKAREYDAFITKILDGGQLPLPLLLLE